MDTLFWNTNLRSDNHMRAPFLAPPVNHHHVSSISNNKPSFVTASDDVNEDDAGVIGKGKKGIKGAMVDAMEGGGPGITGASSVPSITTTPTKNKPIATTTGIGKVVGMVSSPSGGGGGGGLEPGALSSSVIGSSIPPVPLPPPPPALTEV